MGRGIWCAFLLHVRGKPGQPGPSSNAGPVFVRFRCASGAPAASGYFGGSAIYLVPFQPVRGRHLGGVQADRKREHAADTNRARFLMTAAESGPNNHTHFRGSFSKVRLEIVGAAFFHRCFHANPMVV